MSLYFVRSRFNRFFDGEPGTGGDPGQGGGGGNPKTFTEDDVKKEVQKQLQIAQGKDKAAREALIRQLEEITNQKNGTESQLSELQNTIEELKNRDKSKEQLAAEKEAKLKKEYDDKLNGAETVAKTFKSKYESKLIDVEILSVAKSEKAFRENQILAFLKPMSSVVDVLDDGGKPTGDEQVRVKYKTKDKDGKPVTHDLTVLEAVKMMKEQDDYANLFIDEGTGGVGGGPNNSQSQRKKDAAALVKMSDEEYREYRKKTGGKVL